MDECTESKEESISGECFMDLKHKIAIVTGAGRGIGQAIAVGLAGQGADVAVVDLDRESAEETARSVRELGSRSLVLQKDISSLPHIDAMISETLKAFGRIDILVNNAAVSPIAGILDTTEAQWDQINLVNAKGAFFCMQRVARVLVEQGEGGRIVNIGSIAGKGYLPLNTAYAASKGAVIAMTKSAAGLLAKHRINVNSVCPGRTETPLSRKNYEERAKQRGITWEEMTKEKIAPIPTGQMNEPEDVAEMVVLLCGKGGRNITGQAINIDGGVAMH